MGLANGERPEKRIASATNPVLDGNPQFFRLVPGERGRYRQQLFGGWFSDRDGAEPAAESLSFFQEKRLVTQENDPSAPGPRREEGCRACWWCRDPGDGWPHQSPRSLAAGPWIAACSPSGSPPRLFGRKKHVNVEADEEISLQSGRRPEPPQFSRQMQEDRALPGSRLALHQDHPATRLEKAFHTPRRPSQNAPRQSRRFVRQIAGIGDGQGVGDILHPINLRLVSSSYTASWASQSAVSAITPPLAGESVRGFGAAAAECPRNSNAEGSPARVANPASSSGRSEKPAVRLTVARRRASPPPAFPAE